jgi:hypothetical protein
LIERSVEEYREFVDDFVRQLDGVPDLLRSGQPVRLQFTLTLSIDEGDLEQFTAELKRVEVALLGDHFDQI